MQSMEMGDQKTELNIVLRMAKPAVSVKNLITLQMYAGQNPELQQLQIKMLRTIQMLPWVSLVFMFTLMLISRLRTMFNQL